MRKLYLTFLLVILGSISVSAQIYTTSANNSNPLDTCNGTASFYQNLDSLNIDQASFVWGDGFMTIATDTTFVSGLCPGTYVLTYYDSIQGTISNTFTIGYNSNGGGNSLQVSYFFTDISDSSQCDGSITLMATGGLPPYTYTSSIGTTTQQVDNICFGCYYFDVTDSGGNSTTLFVCFQGDSLGGSNVIGNNPYPSTPSTGNLGWATVQDCIEYASLDSTNVGALLIAVDSVAWVQWTLYDTNGNIALQTIVSYSLPFDTVSGIYDLTLFLDCALKSTQYLSAVASKIMIDFSSLGLNENELSGVRIVNPFATELTIKFAEENSYNVALVNIFGQVLVSDRIVNGDALTLDTNKLPKGTYLLTIESNSKTYRTKVIKF